MSNTGERKVSVTDADREKPVSLVPDHQTWCQAVAHADCCRGECDCEVDESRAAVAEALADEREKALKVVQDALIDGNGTHDCWPCGETGALRDGRECPLCAGWGTL